MWSQQCYLGFDTGANHHAQLHLHFGKILPPLLTTQSVCFQFVCVWIQVFILPPSSCPQNSTSNKYHLSAITLLANWSDMTGTSFVTSDMLFFLGSDFLNSKHYWPIPLHSSLLSQQHQSGLPAEYAGPLLHVQHRANSRCGADLLSQHIQTAGPTLWSHHQPVCYRYRCFLFCSYPRFLHLNVDSDEVVCWKQP